MTFMVFVFQVAPRLAFGVHAKHQNLGAGLACTCAMKCLKRNMSNSTEGRASYAFPLDSDLRMTLKVVVKFLARMPVPIKLAVGWDFNQINQDLATRSEFFTQRVLQ